MSSNYKSLDDSKILLIYVYYEKKNQTKNQTNLAFFLKYGLDKRNWKNLDITCVLIVNGDNSEVMIPNLENLHVVYNNSNNYSDYEGWYDGISYIKNKNNAPIHLIYDYMALINASSSGPFMDENSNSHWLYPFYDKIVSSNSVACSPYINNFERPILSCHFIFIKITEHIMHLLCECIVEGNFVLFKKKDKMDAIKSGEFGLSIILTDNNYNICCLFYETLKDIYNPDYIRREFVHETNSYRLNKTIFIKNIWRMPFFNPEHPQICYASKPVSYDYCINFIYEKLQMQNIFEDFFPENLDYSLLPITNSVEFYSYANWKNKKQFYQTHGYAEEYILFPKKGSFVSKSYVVYAHYDAGNRISDYVINSLKVLHFLGYNILFYTASPEIKNIDPNILPFEISFVPNEGSGTDYKILLTGLKKMREDNVDCEWVMFINDSLLFPINGVNNFLHTITNMRENCDFWGHWDSNDIKWHIVGVPLEFKYKITREHIINFLDFRLPKCNEFLDYINIIETELCKFLNECGFKCNVVIKETEFKNAKGLGCPSHHPYLLSQWIKNPSAFAIKWKYCISYLNKSDVSKYFNFLTRYMYYGPKGSISKGQIVGAFPDAEKFPEKIKEFNQTL